MWKVREREAREGGARRKRMQSSGGTEPLGAERRHG